ncbi:MAG TPA: sensor histidine kinase [Devosia sp.]|nr:sensor histidine kinase [Devosia sp.]
MAVTGQDLPGFRKPRAASQRRAWPVAQTAAGIRLRLLKGFSWVQRLLALTVFSSLTRRIIVLNLVALAVLVTGILYLNQWRAGLIDARVQSLRVQGQIIAAAVAASAKVSSDVIQVDPERLLQLKTGESNLPSYADPSLEFPINPEQVAPLLRNLITPTRTRARIYDSGGFMILDSASIYQRGEVIRTGKAAAAKPANWWTAILSWVPGDNFPPYLEYGVDEGIKYPEVAAALSGSPADVVRVDQNHQLIISVAVPVQRVRATVGVLLLSTQPGEIDSIVATERWGVVRIALVAAAVTIILSLLLASTIAGPLRRLSEAAEKVQASMTSREEIPDFTYRTDEVGHLSRALRAMTSALYNRIEGIERFAADVAHELKNPLTSLRSAVETLPRAKKPEDVERLNAIIQHDVRRLDRLISDISNASRLDAELARESAERVDVGKLCEAMVSLQADLAAPHNVNVVLTRHPGRHEPIVLGHDSRLAQVVSNLIDNAISFSPPGGTVAVDIATSDTQITIQVADEGPGIRGDITRIFQRFYTDRPEGEHFGDHSGLGLAISKQIIDAHGGTIRAENRTDRSGALFTVILNRAPAARGRR